MIEEKIFSLNKLDQYKNKNLENNQNSLNILKCNNSNTLLKIQNNFKN